MSPRRRDLYTVSDPAQLAEVVSPVRHQILRLLSALGAASARELAEHLGRQAESLYYHLRALEKVGLIEIAEVRRVGRHKEKTYRPIARYLRTDPDQVDPDYLAAMQRSAAALLRLTERQLQSALEHQRDAGVTRHPAFRIQQLQVRLKPKVVAELNRRLNDLLQFIAESDDPEARELIAVTIAAAPLHSDLA
ncbi:MAG: helix-turn-helix domain-containing protein [Planctomycetota bacterium]